MMLVVAVVDTLDDEPRDLYVGGIVVVLLLVSAQFVLTRSSRHTRTIPFVSHALFCVPAHTLLHAPYAAHQVDTEGLYKTLGVAKDADEKAIRKAYRKIAVKEHPDKGEATPTKNSTGANDTVLSL